MLINVAFKPAFVMGRAIVIAMSIMTGITAIATELNDETVIPSVTESSISTASIATSDEVAVDSTGPEEATSSFSLKERFNRVMDYTLGEGASDAWGLGLGIGTVVFPHYPGSDQSETLTTPFPFPIYRGKHFQLDDDGLVANVFNSDRFQLDFSLNGALPVSDEENRVRQGLDDLDFILEIGPALEVTLAEYSNTALRIDFPLRAAFEVNLEEVPRDTGLIFDPRLHIEQNFDTWNWDFDVGLLFANERYHALYYDVPLSGVTNIRPEFEATSGLTAFRASSSIEQNIADWRVLAYLRYLNLADAANRDSPLLVKDDYWAAGLAVVWFFKKPKRR